MARSGLSGTYELDPGLLKSPILCFTLKRGEGQSHTTSLRFPHWGGGEQQDGLHLERTGLAEDPEEQISEGRSQKGVEVKKQKSLLLGALLTLSI